jgi:hypothetical protein
MDEVKTYVTPDGLDRAGIVRRPDGLFCVYLNWKVDRKFVDDGTLIDPYGWKSWFDDHTPLLVLSSGCSDQEPEHGIYGTLDDALWEMRALRG